MTNLIEILVKRDGIDEEEAKELILETQEQIINSDPFEAEDIICENLGLELDYIFDILSM